MNDDQFHELLYQALETEPGGVQVDEAALPGVARLPTVRRLPPTGEPKEVATVIGAARAEQVCSHI